jgi:hypothetical protein
MIRPNTVRSAAPAFYPLTGLGVNLFDRSDPPNWRPPLRTTPPVTIKAPAPPAPPPPATISLRARMPVPIYLHHPPPPPIQTTPPGTCQPGYYPVNGVCEPTTPPGTCQPGYYPVNGVCEPTSVPCPGGTVDASGNCVPTGGPNPTNGTCPPGWQLDSAGHCTPAGSEANPYSLYLPPASNAVPAGATPAGTCGTGFFTDSAGSCCANGTPVDASGVCAPTPNPILTWLEASTLIPGVPNYEVAGGALAALAAVFLLTHRSGGRKR